MVNVLTKIVGKNNIFLDEPMSKHSTFGIGGKAHIYITPTNYFDMFECISELEKNLIQWKIIGNGSNLLFSDSGVDGAIIGTSKICEVCNLGSGRVVASSGVKLSKLAYEMAELGLSGLEFSSGIPASVGGAIFMNAGAFGKSMSDIVRSVGFFNGERVVEAYAKELNFSYRQSLFKSHPNFVIMYCELELQKSSKEKVLEEIKRLQVLRQTKQPIGKSAGSVFKAIDNIPAGKLIDDCGLKGERVGDAVISTKHANFILNEGKATAEDVLKLIEIIREKVNEKYNKLLELEIEIVR